MRAERVKLEYLKHKELWKDLTMFDCGDQIAYEMEMDYKTMKQALKDLEEFQEILNQRNDGKITFANSYLKNIILSLKKRIEKY